MASGVWGPALVEVRRCYAGIAVGDNLFGTTSRTNDWVITTIVVTTVMVPIPLNPNSSLEPNRSATGAPPGSGAIQYIALWGTLSDFTDLASQEFTAGIDLDASARYSVFLHHVNEVLPD